MCWVVLNIHAKQHPSERSAGSALPSFSTSFLLVFLLLLCVLPPGTLLTTWPAMLMFEYKDTYLPPGKIFTTKIKTCFVEKAVFVLGSIKGYFHVQALNRRFVIIKLLRKQSF